MDVSSDQVQSLRQQFLGELEGKDGGESYIHVADLNRIKSGDDWLRRFLLHHDGSQTEALSMLWEVVEWRKQFKTNDINESNVTMEYLIEGGMFPHNRDKDGAAMLIFKCKKHVKGTKDMDKLKHCVVYWFERLERQENGKQITIFFDMSECGLSNMDIEFTKYLIGLFKQYYPYFLNNIIIFEMAWILNAAFAVIKQLLPEKAVGKIKQVNKKKIFDYVNKEEALICWGGKDGFEFSFVPEAVPEKPSQEIQVANGNNKKVHFADGSPMSTTAAPVFDKDLSDDGSSLSISPSEVITFVKDGNEMVSTIDLQNSDSTIILSYKLKTTSPEKFRVRPSAGCLSPGDRATITVHLLPGFQLSGLSRDKFLLMSMPVESDDMSSTQLTELWRGTNSKTPNLHQHRLRCSQSDIAGSGSGGNYSSALRNGGVFTGDGAGGGGGGDAATSKQLAELSASVSKLSAANATTTKTLSRTLMLQYVLVVLVALLVVLVGCLLQSNSRGGATSADYDLPTGACYRDEP